MKISFTLTQDKDSAGVDFIRIDFFRDNIWIDERNNENAVNPLDFDEARKIAQKMLLEYACTETDMKQTFTLSITLGNDAMQTTDDVARALRQTAETLVKMFYISEIVNDPRSIKDENGNTVGSYEVKSK